MGNHKQFGWSALLFTALICLVAGLAVGVLLLPALLDDRTQPVSGQYTPTATSARLPNDPVPAPTDAATPLPDNGQATEEDMLVSVVERVSPSVVGITVYQRVSDELYGGQSSVVPAYGSGFVIEGGYIVTNAHVVLDTDRIEVILPGETDPVEAEFIGADEASDVGVIRVDRQDLLPASMGDSQALRVGQTAIAIGNPYHTILTGTTVTKGIISALDRRISVDGYTMTFIQTDAAINPGNSGGALVNRQGEVIGINTLKSIQAYYDGAGNVVSSEGIGFAIPVHIAMPLVQQLIDHGSVPRPGIGISGYALDELDEEYYGRGYGIYIGTVAGGGPADQAGLRQGDIILEIDGQALSGFEQLRTLLEGAGIGSVVRFKAFRANDASFDGSETDESWRSQITGEEFEGSLSIVDMNTLDYDQ